MFTQYMIHLNEISILGRTTETKINAFLGRGDLDGDREGALMDMEFLFSIDENVLKLDCDDNCISLLIY